MFDEETRFYYLKSRYYSPELQRFITADSFFAGIGRISVGNLYGYCSNSSITALDSQGQWPKWLSGVVNVVSGICEAAAGVALIAAAPLVGLPGVAAGVVLLADGSATVTQGIAQITNDIAGTNVLYDEENILKSAVISAGRSIGGESGAKVAKAVYEVSIFVANLYGPAYVVRYSLQQAGVVSIKVPISKLLNNPADPCTQGMPAPGVISTYCRTIPQTGYGRISVVVLPNGYYRLADGHHRIAALKSLGYTIVKVYIAK